MENLLSSLLHAMNEDDPDRRVQFSERFQHKMHKGEQLVSKNVWSDEAACKLNGTDNRHNSVLGSRESTHSCGQGDQFTRTVWCELSYRGLIGPFFLGGTVTGPVYLNMLRTSILLTIHQLYGNEPFYFQEDGAPPQYH
jgi:hypothetical protein